MGWHRDPATGLYYRTTRDGRHVNAYDYNQIRQGTGWYRDPVTGMHYRTTNNGANINTDDYNRIVRSQGYPGTPGR